MDRLGIGQDHDHVLGALGEGAFDGLGHMDFLAPLLSADGIAVQGIDHGIAPRPVPGIAGRQEHQHIAVRRIAFEILFQRRAMDLDALEANGRCPGHYIGHIGFGLGQSSFKGNCRQKQR